MPVQHRLGLRPLLVGLLSLSSACSGAPDDEARPLGNEPAAGGAGGSSGITVAGAAGTSPMPPPSGAGGVAGASAGVGASGSAGRSTAPPGSAGGQSQAATGGAGPNGFVKGDGGAGNVGDGGDSRRDGADPGLGDGSTEVGCLMDSANADELRRWLSELSGAAPALVGGEAVTIRERSSDRGRALARAYLTERYEDLGYDVSEHDYGSGTNLVAERTGADASVFIVSAHLDAVSQSPGADDDGSGIISGLAVASALAGCTLEHTLRFVAFDQEELGLLGSRAYAQKIRREEPNQIMGLLQLEMTAYDSDGDGRYLVVDCDRPESTPLADTLAHAVDDLALPLTATSFCTDASDHSEFWRVGTPAIVAGEAFFSDDALADPNPCYHRSCDTIDSLDFEYMADITTAVMTAVARLVGAGSTP